MTNDKKLYLCRWYFRGTLLKLFCNFCFITLLLSFAAGLALLPFIWTVNAIWFFQEAFRKPEYEEQKQIRKCKLHKTLVGHIVAKPRRSEF